MINEEDYMIAFQLISIAGDSKSIFIEVIKKAKKFEFEAAEELYKQGENELLKAHKLQTDMIQKEASGNPVPVNIILVHAQDHLTMATMTKEKARESIDLYSIISSLSKKLK